MRWLAGLVVVSQYAAALQFTRTRANQGHPFLKYDAFLIDGYGTLHDNQKARPGAAACVKALVEAGKLVIIGSNSAARAEDERAFLTDLGVTAGLATSLDYARVTDEAAMVSVLTSGHVLREALREGRGFAGKVGRRPLYLGAPPAELARLHPPGDAVVPAATLDEATGVVACAGVPCAADAETAAEAGRRNVPLLALAGDDVWTPAGTRALRGADALVRAYRDAGGDNCRVFGKPHVHFFKEAAKLAERHGARNLCVVGDSLSHDVAGARNAGLDVAWLYPDVHTERGHTVAGRLLRDKADPSRRPDYILASLSPPDALSRVAQEEAAP